MMKKPKSRHMTMSQSRCFPASTVTIEVHARVSNSPVLRARPTSYPEPILMQQLGKYIHTSYLLCR